VKERSQFSIPFTRLKNAVLGNGFELSLVFINKTLSRKLNRTYRKKDKSADVLSFPLSKQSGEIFIDLETAQKEAPGFDMPFPKFVAYLFIHGILHLKGMRHGDTMERKEKKLLHGASNSSWY
jgi:probable rRNA maturation factor